jgi:flagellar basal body-associated protein FliL
MSDNITAQNTDLSTWITLYIDMIMIAAVRIYVPYFRLKSNTDEQNSSRKFESVYIYLEIVAFCLKLKYRLFYKGLPTFQTNLLPPLS